MTSLYYAPLNQRLRAYYNEVKENQININNDYILNQQLLFDDRLQRNSFAIFENQKKLTEELKKKSKTLNSEDFQKKLHSENPVFYLPPSEKSTMLALEEGPKIFKLDAPKYTSDIVPYEVRRNIEEEQKTKPQGATPKSGSPKNENLTPLSQLAEDAKLRIELKDNPLYKEFRNLPRARRGGNPTIDKMREFAKNNNIDIPEHANSSVIADKIIRGISEKKTTGGGLKKFMKKKYKR